MNVFAVAIGGGLGAVFRYWLDGVIARRQTTPFPLSTLVINVSGSTMLGLVVAAMLNGDLPPVAQVWIVSGFFGGYTTFSTFVYETLRLVESESWRQAFWNVALSGPLSFGGAALTYLLIVRT
jgi:fluoride exporter